MYQDASAATYWDAAVSGQKALRAKGALRLDLMILSIIILVVRKHRAPKGALRREAQPSATESARGSESPERQKVH